MNFRILEAGQLEYNYMISPGEMVAYGDDYFGKEITETYHCFDEFVNNEKLYIQEKDFEYDFCNGFRIHFFTENIAYQITIKDKSSGNIIYNKIFVPDKNKIYAYSKIYFIDYEVSIAYYTYIAPQNPPEYILKYDPTGKDIAIFISYSNQRSGFGDTISWTNSILYFAEKYPKANIKIIATNPFMEEFMLNYTNIGEYKNVEFMDYMVAVKGSFYAEYLVGYFNLANLKNSQVRFNYYKNSNCFDGLNKAALDILGIDDIDGYKEKPKLKIRNIPRIKSKRPYVCLSVNASSFYKKWVNKDGWERVIDYVHSLGYDIYCIDQNSAEEYNSLVRSYMPDGVIDDTGNKPIAERAEMLMNCEFFIGLGSGLSWLAWLCDVPVVLISGFSKPKSEFYTPYRVINYNVCNGCWNELNLDWKANSCCPVYGNNLNEEHFLICSFGIRSEAVIKAINRIPAVQKILEAKN